MADLGADLLRLAEDVRIVELSAVDSARRRGRGDGAAGARLDRRPGLLGGRTTRSCAVSKRTKEAPGTLETVVLAEHRISYEAHPYVDVLLGDAHLTRVKLTLLITVDVTGLAASISAGRLKGLSEQDLGAAARV